VECGRIATETARAACAVHGPAGASAGAALATAGALATGLDAGGVVAMGTDSTE
jgi:hypothetical protein